jgi:uncharacterized protein YkwD
MIQKIQTEPITPEQESRLDSAIKIAQTKESLKPQLPHTATEEHHTHHSTKLPLAFLSLLLLFALVVVFTSIHFFGGYSPQNSTQSLPLVRTVQVIESIEASDILPSSTQEYLEPIAIEFEENTQPLEFSISQIIDTTSCTFDDISSTQLQCLINEYRSSQGLSELTNIQQLNSVAFDHSVWMSQQDSLSHIGRNASTFDQRCAEVFLTCRQQMIARGPFSSSIKCLEAWILSGAHNNSLLNTSYSEYGVGINNGYCTVLLN